MKTKEIKISVPDGYEIDKENSTLECVKFKPIKKDITYDDVCNSMLGAGYFTNSYGTIIGGITYDSNLRTDKNNATNKEQLEMLLALNQILNITEYYNRLHVKLDKCYTILYDKNNKEYIVAEVSPFYSFGIKPIFNRMEDVQAVIDNPNFREILDIAYKTV